MFQKTLFKPRDLLQLEALHRRLPRSHPAYDEIEAEHGRCQAGYYGEMSLTRLLARFADQAYVFQNVRLPVRGEHVQMDVLLLTDTCAIIIEIKHWRGDLHFSSPDGPVLRSYEHKEQLFSNPLHQAEEQAAQFQHWRADQGFPPLSIHPLVVFSHRHVKLHPLPTNSLYRNLLTRDTLPRQLRHLLTTDASPQNSTCDLQKEIQLLHIHNQTSNYNYTAVHGITQNDIISGVNCPYCGKQKMHRTRKNWHCPHCGGRHKLAHAFALTDYKLMFGPRISNREARVYLGVSSRHTCRRLLQPFTYPSTTNDPNGYYWIK
ncbi:nuclease-like protein [Salsuginibacillus halophilus]|uniref:Nuclease-like protein n=1 Tax=Salsuginibacillus halophilus TaxID=517424 RepID=A0A2P8HQE8_9BACI|nr:NERD domain-containing protein [Salsuginibacillus halophilus]PSL48439.1 nuclease-like protein [Salsuginibacillus halophilus]